MSRECVRPETNWEQVKLSKLLLTGRLGLMARRAISIAALVLAGPVVVGMLQATFSSLRHPTGGTCVFNDILYFASGGTGLFVYRTAPWIVMAATVAAIYVRWQERPFATSIRGLSAPGFGLVCTLLLNPLLVFLGMFTFVNAPYYAFATSPICRWPYPSSFSS